MRYDQDFIDRVTDAVDLVDVISEYTTLKRSGSSLMGCCPFHSEKTPSFSVSREKQLYHCFGCGESGNLIGFVMKAENLSFPEAIERLAERAGIPVPEPIEQSREERERMESIKRSYEINRLAANAYYKNFQKNPEAKTYLLDRGLTENTMKELGIGLAPENWRSLTDLLRSKGYRDQELIEAGVSIRGKNNSLYDRFRGRILFPIQNGQGKVIGFGGRAWKDSHTGPKYLNTQESIIFHKGKELFNLNRARRAVSAEGFLLLVEGYMDVAALYNHGIKNAVAALGTAFTPDHARLLRRITSEVILCFDGDQAGESATEKALTVLDQTSLTVRILRLPPEHDPDSFIKENGREAFLTACSGSITPVEFRLDSARKQFGLSSYAGRLNYMKKACEILSHVDPAEALYFAGIVASQTGFDVEKIKESIKASGKDARTPEVSLKPEFSKKRLPKAYRQAESVVMTVFSNDPKRLSSSGLSYEDFEEGFYQWLYQKIQEHDQNKALTAANLFVSEEDMIYNKRTSVILGNSIDRALELYPEALATIKRQSHTMQLNALREKHQRADTEEEKSVLQGRISKLLKHRNP